MLPDRNEVGAKVAYSGGWGWFKPPGLAGVADTGVALKNNARVDVDQQ